MMNEQSVDLRDSRTHLLEHSVRSTLWWSPRLFPRVFLRNYRGMSVLYHGYDPWKESDSQVFLIETFSVPSLT